MKTGTLPCSARWHTLLCAVVCLLAILPFGNAQSIPELKSKARDGDVQAQLALAKAYHLGEGVVKDEVQAAQWWEKAAEHGDPAAQINLGVAYSHGAGGPKNYAAALRWYTKAVDQGNAQAQSDIAMLYHLGQGVPQDDAEAVRWWKAAEQGDVPNLSCSSICRTQAKWASGRCLFRNRVEVSNNSAGAERNNSRRWLKKMV